MKDAFDLGRSEFNKKKKGELAKDEEARGVIRRVFERSKDRMRDEGYDLTLTGDTIFVYYIEDDEASMHDPDDEDDIEQETYYDDKTRRFYRFVLTANRHSRRGWHLNKFSGIHLDKHNEEDINTEIDTSKPWEDELLRILGEFCEFNRWRATSNNLSVSNKQKQRAKLKSKSMPDPMSKPAVSTGRRARIFNFSRLFAIVKRAIFSIVFLFFGQFLMLAGSYMTPLFGSGDGPVGVLLFAAVAIVGLPLWILGTILSLPLFLVEGITGWCLAFAPGMRNAGEVLTVCNF